MFLGRNLMNPRGGQSCCQLVDGSLVCRHRTHHIYYHIEYNTTYKAKQYLLSHTYKTTLFTLTSTQTELTVTTANATGHHAQLHQHVLDVGALIDQGSVHLGHIRQRAMRGHAGLDGGRIGENGRLARQVILQNGEKVCVEQMRQQKQPNECQEKKSLHPYKTTK